MIELLVESVSKGGNLLLNVGPTARGVFDQRAQDRLKAMGDWMKFNNRSVYNCTEAPADFKAPANTLLTYNPKTNRLYIHLLDYPMGSMSYFIDFVKICLSAADNEDIRDRCNVAVLINIVWIRHFDSVYNKRISVQFRRERSGCCVFPNAIFAFSQVCHARNIHFSELRFHFL